MAFEGKIAVIIGGGSGMAAAVACNGAIEALGRGLAVELSPIRVNTVAPGTIDSEYWNGRPPEVRKGALDFYGKISLAGRAGTEERLPTPHCSSWTTGS